MDTESTHLLALSDIFHLLRTPRRVYVIRILAGCHESQSTRSLAKQVVAIEEEVRAENVSGESYRNVYNALSHTHLPTLADAGVINYDSDRQTIMTGPNFQISLLFVTLNRVVYEAVQNERYPPCEQWLDLNE